MEGKEIVALSNAEVLRKGQITLELEKVTLMEEKSQRRKSCSLARGRYKCTKFFGVLRVADSHKRNDANEVLYIVRLVFWIILR